VIAIVFAATSRQESPVIALYLNANLGLNGDHVIG
jgi:hypothetical protein